MNSEEDEKYIKVDRHNKKTKKNLKNKEYFQTIKEKRQTYGSLIIRQQIYQWQTWKPEDCRMIPSKS